MPNDVALDFRGTSFDGISARSQVTVRPNPFINGVSVAPEQLAVRAKQFLRELLNALIEFTPKQLLNGTFRARRTCGRDAAEGPQLVQAHDFDFRVALSEPLTNDGIL